MCKNKQVTPIILAGGKSSRMGKNKAFVLVDGKPMLERVLEKITEIFVLPPILVVNEQALYAHLGFPLVTDVIKGKGPLGGIQAGLQACSTQYAFVFACDMPFLEKKLICSMLEKIDINDVVIPRHDGNLEPLHAIYSRSCLPLIEKNLDADKLSLLDFLPQVKVFYFEPKKELKSFTNVNTLQDLQKANEENCIT